MNHDYDICWCGHSRAQHGVFGPMLCNHCTDCTGFIFDLKLNAKFNTITDSDVAFEHQAMLEERDDDFD